MREAREARGITATALAEMVGVTRQAVSQYETGGVSPHPEVMNRISDVLNLPLQHFWREVPAPEAGPVFFRSFSSATKMAQTRAERRKDWLVEIVSFLNESVEFPTPNFPRRISVSDPNDLPDSWIENIATETRRYWGLGDKPISNVVRLLEKNGAIVSRTTLDADTLDAFSQVIDGRPYIFLSSDKASAARSRFDAAHELGHIVLHSDVDQRHLGNPASHKKMEDQSHRFAASFLLPDTSFSRDFRMPTLESFQILKTKWVLSIGMMIRRAADLGFISHEQEQKLWISYSRRGWRKREPLDDVLPVEEPKMLRFAFELLLDEGVQTGEEIKARLPFATRDIEELAGLPEGFLEREARARVVTLRGTDTGNVVPFPGGKRQ